MASNSFGKLFRFTTFGESHGKAIGLIADGVPAGMELDEAWIQRDLDKRRPGQSAVTTPRKESDRVHILSGVFEGITTGHPVGMVIYNSDAVSTQYDNIKDLFRPGHADYTYFHKYRIRDYRGSGRASGRETACRVAAGAIAKRIIEQYGIVIFAGGVQIGNVLAKTFIPDQIYNNPVRSVDPGQAPEMEKLIRMVAAEGDSVGGVIECRIQGCPTGIGEPLYDRLDARLASAMLGLGAIKGIEFGSGFKVAEMKGSESNDPVTKGGFSSNHAGGILGGISTGQDIIFRVAVKPTSSISKMQKSLGLDGEEKEFSIDGRHDPCLVPRMVPVIEAMTAVVFADLVLLDRSSRIEGVRSSV